MVHYKTAKYNAKNNTVHTFRFLNDHGRFPAPGEFKKLSRNGNYLVTVKRLRTFFMRKTPQSRAEFYNQQHRIEQLSILISLYSD